MHRRRLWGAVSGVVLGVLVAGWGALAQSRSFTEELLVTEVQLVVEPPEGLQPRPDVLRVLENGIERRVTKVEKIPWREAEADAREAHPWRTVIYVDAALCQPETISTAVLALADQLPRLVELGSVEVVVADPEPRQRLAPTRSEAAIRDTLARLAADPPVGDAIGRLREAFGGEAEGGEAKVDRAAASISAEVAVVRGQADRLVDTVAAARESGPQALLLVSDGYFLQPQSFYLADLSGYSTHLEEVVSAAERDLAEVTETVAGVLAGYGWVTLPLPLRRVELQSQSIPTDYEQYQDSQRSPTEEGGAPAWKLGHRKRPPVRLLDPRVADVFLLPRLAPLRAVARSTSGSVVRFVDNLPGELERLEGRWQVWYQTSHPISGALLEVQVTETRTGEAFRAPAWVRSSTPKQVAEARLRSLLGGGSDRGSLPLGVEVSVPSGSKGELDLTVRAELDALQPRSERSPNRVVRVSFAVQEGDGGFQVQHQQVVLEPPVPASWAYHERVGVPQGAERGAVLLEDLVSGAWGATPVSLGPADGSP
jgi:hypothetical protein